MGIMQKVGAAFGLRASSTTGPRSAFSEREILEKITEGIFFGDVSSIRVTRSRAMQIPTVAKVRRVGCTTIARLPLEAIAPSGKRWPIAAFPVLSQPEATKPLSTTLVWTLDELMFYPAAYWHVLARTAAGWPSQVELVKNADADLDEYGNLTGIGGTPIHPGDFIRFDGNDDGLLVDGADTLRRAIVLNRVASLAEENPVPSIELHNEGDDISGEQIDELVKHWSSRRRKGGVAYTNKAISVKTHGQHPEQLLIDGRKRLDLELCRQTGAPAWVADVPLEGQALNYTNRASRNWELIDLFLAAALTIIEDRLTMNDVTPRGTTVKFNLDELTREDQKSRFETYQIGVNGGFIDAGWIATQEGWEAPK